MTSRREYRSQKFNAELVEHISRLRAFAISLCGDADRGDDLVQETLLKALSHVNSYKPGNNMRAWLFTILRNTYFTQHRRGRFEVRDEDGAIANSVPVRPGQESCLELSEFATALSQLYAQQREALILVGAEGFTYDEAAEICECSSGTIKSRVNRAREKLSAALRAEAPELSRQPGGEEMPTPHGRRHCG